ncbi:unnamed protein product, partial [Echinostoma caproni]|uniref:Uncharacterized protein n=1 Tax=Echinostoma caproni TaxID=27848 RepID=A0A183BCL1_9TREM
MTGTPLDDLFIFSFPPSPGMRRLVRYHSTGSLYPISTGDWSKQTGTSSLHSQTARSPSRVPAIQDSIDPVPPVSEPKIPTGAVTTLSSGLGHKSTGPVYSNPTEPKCDLYLDGAGGLRRQLLRPSTNAMCDAIMAFANLIEQPHNDTENDEAANQALNAMTYPSSQNAYHLDIERLVRG